MSYPPTISKVNASVMQNKIGQQVSLFGRVDSVQQGVALVTAADQIQIQVRYGHPVQMLAPGQIVEVVGLVENSSTINAAEVHPFVPGNFDLAAWNEVVKYASAMPKVF